MASIELKFQGTFNKSDYLSEFSCGICQQYLTEQDISKGNYRLYVSDYANEVDKEEYFKNKIINYHVHNSFPLFVVVLNYFVIVSLFKKRTFNLHTVKDYLFPSG